MSISQVGALLEVWNSCWHWFAAVPVATGEITVPAGRDRRFVVQAFDAATQVCAGAPEMTVAEP